MIRRLQLLVVAGDPGRRRVLDRRCRSCSTCSTWRSSSSAARYVLVRLGLTDLEAGYAVSQLHGHVGDQLRVTYTLRNASRIPKPWLEVHNPTTLPGGLPGPGDHARRPRASGRGSSGRR